MKLLIFIAAVGSAFMLIVGGVLVAPNIISNGLVAGLMVSVWGVASVVLCLRAAMLVSSRLESKTRN